MRVNSDKVDKVHQRYVCYGRFWWALMWTLTLWRFIVFSLQAHKTSGYGTWSTQFLSRTATCCKNHVVPSKGIGNTDTKNGIKRKSTLSHKQLGSNYHRTYLLLLRLKLEAQFWATPKRHRHDWTTPEFLPQPNEYLPERPHEQHHAGEQTNKQKITKQKLRTLISFSFHTRQSLVVVVVVFSTVSFRCGNLQPAMKTTKNDGICPLSDLEKRLLTILHTAVDVAFVPADNRPSNYYVPSQVCATIVVQSVFFCLLCC